MKKNLLVITLALAASLGCKQSQVLETARVVLTCADSARSAARTYVDACYAAGKMTDAEHDKWAKLDVRAGVATDALRLALAEAEKMQGKTTVQKIVQLAQDLAEIVRQIETMIKTWD